MNVGDGANERSWPLDLPFGSFGHRKWPNVAKMSKKQRFFSKYEFVQARTFERKVIKTWL